MFLLVILGVFWTDIHVNPFLFCFSIFSLSPALFPLQYHFPSSFSFRFPFPFLLLLFKYFITVECYPYAYGVEKEEYWGIDGEIWNWAATTSNISRGKIFILYYKKKFKTNNWMILFQLWVAVMDLIYTICISSFWFTVNWFDYGKKLFL